MDDNDNIFMLGDVRGIINYLTPGPGRIPVCWVQGSPMGAGLDS